MGAAKQLYRFEISPQTAIRCTQGDRIFFRIPRTDLRPAGLKRLLRLERYNQYKQDLLALSKQKGFTFPYQGAHIKFFVPVPRSWSKKKKAAYHLKLHMGRPDVDNMLKGVFDSLFSEDKYIADVRVTKFWVDFEAGWIDVEVSEPDFANVAQVGLCAVV